MSQKRPVDLLPDPATAESHIVAILRDLIAVPKPVQKPWADVRAAAVRRDSSLVYSEGRVRLGRALAALHASGEVHVPGSDDLWGHRYPLPRLPRWVEHRKREKRAPKALTLVPDDVAALLPGAAGMAVSAAQAAALTAVADWLRKGGRDRPVVPSRERSLEIYRNEKRLDRNQLLSSKLFTTGVLSLPLMRAELVPLPLAATVWVPGAVAVEPACFVAENHHTWVSLLRAARAAAASHGGVHVWFGGGEQFRSGIRSAASLRPAVSVVSYFGDLDNKGLGIARAAAETAKAEGLPEVRPAVGLYRMLVKHGIRCPAKPVAAATAEQRLAWLGREFTDAVGMWLSAGVRLPQEAVGTELLRGTVPASWV
jgi:hypothetical protein